MFVYYRWDLYGTALANMLTSWNLYDTVLAQHYTTEKMDLDRYLPDISPCR